MNTLNPTTLPQTTKDWSQADYELMLAECLRKLSKEQSCAVINDEFNLELTTDSLPNGTVYVSTEFC